MRQPKHKRTKAQVQASKKWAAAGRTAQKKKRAYNLAHHLPTRTKAQTQASQKWAAAGRAAASRKRQGLSPLKKHVPALSVPGGSLHGQDICAAVAVAEHLYATTGLYVSDAAIIQFGTRVAGGCLGDYLAEAAACGLAGYRLARFWQCDVDSYVPGLVYGVQLRGGYHAVLAGVNGILSWGMVLPWLGKPAEAWWLEWDTQQTMVV